MSFGKWSGIGNGDFRTLHDPWKLSRCLRLAPASTLAPGNLRSVLTLAFHFFRFSYKGNHTVCTLYIWFLSSILSA